MADTVTRVAATDWVGAAESTLRMHPHFDWLGVTDELGRSDDLRVVVRFYDPVTGSGARLETLVPRDADRPLATLRHLIPGAAWHEREAHDLYALTFAGGDDRPLLIPAEGEPGHVAAPLRKDSPLVARLTTPWPGFAGDEVGRRRQPPPGVPDERRRRR